MKRFALAGMALVVAVAGALAQIAAGSTRGDPWLQPEKPIFAGLTIDEKLFAEVSKPASTVVNIVDLEAEDPTVSDLLYPVWIGKSFMFFSLDQKGGYRFLELAMGQSGTKLKEVKLSGSGGAAGGLLDESLLSSRKENDPPIKNPVANPQTGELAFLLAESSSQGDKMTICLLSRGSTVEVKRLYQAASKVVLRSLSWKDKDSLVYTENLSGKEPLMFEVSARQSGSPPKQIGQGYSGPAAAFVAPRIAALQEAKGAGQKLVIIENGVPKDTDISGRLSKLAWDAKGQFVAVIIANGMTKTLGIWDATKGAQVKFTGSSNVYFEEVGAIYSDYAPLWDSTGKVYYTQKTNDFVTQLYRFDPLTGKNTLVHDFAENKYTTISAIGVSENGGGSTSSQVVICGLKDLSSRNRSATLFFFTGPAGDAK
ncbi:MAG: hypothetical protein WCQ50_04535 [Spirochaetota bacterium]